MLSALLETIGILGLLVSLAVNFGKLRGAGGRSRPPCSSTQSAIAPRSSVTIVGVAPRNR
jgi:hypothetical protein